MKEANQTPTPSEATPAEPTPQRPSSGLAEAFLLVVSLAEAKGTPKAADLPDNWLRHGEHGKGWYVALNTAQAPRVDEVTGHNVLPLHFSATHDGWPAGIINPAGGILAAAPPADEDSLVAWLKGEIATLKGYPSHLMCGGEVTEGARCHRCERSDLAPWEVIALAVVLVLALVGCGADEFAAEDAGPYCAGALELECPAPGWYQFWDEDQACFGRGCLAPHEAPELTTGADR